MPENVNGQPVEDEAVGPVEDEAIGDDQDLSEGHRRHVAAPSIDRWTIRTSVARLGITQRTIQVALGLIWILDAALQYQPAMWGRGLVTGMILPNAHGQPAPVAWSITNLGHFLLPDVGVWNFLFATLQLGIGVGLLFRRTAKPALALMFAWALGVWWFGEGFGQLLTGRASPLTGAPGAVLLYAAIGVLAWPASRSDARSGSESGGESAELVSPNGDTEHVGVASSAAARGPFGARAALGVWSVFWIASAVLWLLPANRAQGSISDALANAASGQPGWYAHFLNAFAVHFAGIGNQTAWVLALLSLAVGLGPLVCSRPTGFLVLGAAIQLCYWFTGMAFGGVLTGMGTDPNAAPLIVLLAVAMLPTVVPVRASVRTPIASIVRAHPTAASGLAAGVFATLLVTATYPVAAASTSAAPSTSKAATASSSAAGGSGMPGMPGMSGSSSQEGSHGGMGDMSGTAGLGVDAKWRYTGPALPGSEVKLLSSVSSETDKGHAMQTPNCSAKPTASQMLGAVQYVQATSAAVAKYQDLSAAVAAGYIPVTDPHYPVVHYVNPRYMKTAYVMDPEHVQSLVYAFTPYGPVLVAAMYLMPAAGENGPMPYGCLVQWHAHTNLCMSLSAHEYVGFTPCLAGTYNIRTPVMTHVWQVPVAGGPLALDPSDLQVVEAAIEAQQQGLAPSSADGTATSGVATSSGITGTF